MCGTAIAFLATLKQVFDQSVLGHEALWTLGRLKQERSQVFHYTIRFCNLAAESHCNDEVLADMFYISLSEGIKDWLAKVDLPTSFEVLVELTIEVKYSCSGAEQKAMDRSKMPYWRGQFVPRPSPVCAGFFIIERKDKALHLCIDCRGMNDITIKNLLLSYFKGPSSSLS